MRQMMNILAQRVGGSGHAGKHLPDDFADGHIPQAWDGHNLQKKSLNLILQAGYVFRTPTAGGATKEYVSRNGETYYLQAILLSVINTRTRESRCCVTGLIHRNRPHPQEFDNVIEVIAPDLSAWLQPGLKEWFELQGPFEPMSSNGPFASPVPM
jgi:hypothetical protein